MKTQVENLLLLAKAAFSSAAWKKEETEDFLNSIRKDCEEMRNNAKQSILPSSSA